MVGVLKVVSHSQTTPRRRRGVVWLCETMLKALFKLPLGYSLTNQYQVLVKDMDLSNFSHMEYQ